MTGVKESFEEYRHRLLGYLGDRDPVTVLRRTPDRSGDSWPGRPGRLSLVAPAGGGGRFSRWSPTSRTWSWRSAAACGTSSRLHPCVAFCNTLLVVSRPHRGPFWCPLGPSAGALAGPVVLRLILDPYFIYSINHPNQPPLINSFGSLDAEGEANAQFYLPPGASPVPLGKRAHHAYVAIDPVTLASAFASMPQPVLFLP